MGAFLPFLTRSMSAGVYQIDKIELNTWSAATNTTTTGAYRGAGRPEATQYLERILDMAADELGIDPVQIRKKNFIPPESFPLTTVTGSNYDVGEYAKALDEACRVAGYDALRAEQQVRRDRGDTKLLGIGVCTYVEVTAGGLFSEYGSVEVNADGTVTATVGTSAHGQGHETTFAMIVSEMLGVPIDDVRLVQSDTATVPRGTGTMGSRSHADRGKRGVDRQRAGPREGQAARRSPARGEPRRHRASTTVGRSAWPAFPRPRWRGRSWRRRRPTRAAALPTGRARSRPSSTSTRATRPIRSGRTSPWSRSTATPGASSSSATSPSTTAAGC